ncbi:MAG: hypothetical protein GX410_01615 [Elusimicrobia bacterium]|nr:hypothetical protein [Elusimicrobiota bacterium]
MAGRLEQLRVADPVITSLARGYSNSDMVGQVLFPVAEVPKEAGRIPQFGKDAFKDASTVRAVRAGSNIISPEGITPIEFTLEEHNQAYPIDIREREEAEGSVPLQMFAVKTAQDRIQLAHELRCAELAQTAANFGGSDTLASGDKFTNNNSDPVAIIRTAKLAVRRRIGRNPNTLLLGAAAFEALSAHPKLLARIQYSQLGVVTVDLLQAILGIPRVVVGEAIKVNKAGVASDVWGDNAILAYVAPAPQPGVTRSIYEPSFGYTLRKKGYPVGGTWSSADKKIEYADITDILKPQVVGGDAGHLLFDTNA